MTDGLGPGSASQPALPAGVRERQAWRPPMLATLDTLLIGVQTRSESFLRNVSQLVAWHEQLSRRAEPWSVWHPLAFPLQVNVSTPGQPPAQPLDGRSPGAPDSSRAREYAESVSPVLTERPIQRSPTSTDGVPPPRSRSTAPRLSGHDPAFSRRRVRLASLQHPPDAPGRAADQPARGRSGDQPHAARDVIADALTVA